jgi:hypothetical protein
MSGLETPLPGRRVARCQAGAWPAAVAPVSDALNTS